MLRRSSVRVVPRTVTPQADGTGRAEEPSPRAASFPISRGSPDPTTQRSTPMTIKPLLGACALAALAFIPSAQAKPDPPAGPLRQEFPDRELYHRHLQGKP